MRLPVAFAAALALVVSFTVFATSADAGAGPLRQVIAVLRDDVDSDSIASEHAYRFGAHVSHVYGAVLRGYAARVPERVIESLKRDARVAFVEDDRLLWATDTVPTGVDRIEGDKSSQLSGDGAGSVGTGVAIIDTGISPHSELNIAGGYNCAGFFFVNRNAWTDGNGHGTHVAGTVAAKDNGANIVGVAPGAPLWAVRVLSSNGSGYLSWIICGINWVANNAAAKGIKVANMSLGGGGSDDGNCGNSNNDSMHKAICNAVNNKGVTFVVAAGNSNANFATFTPAAYNEVLTVTAVADFNGQPGGGAVPTCRTDVDDTAADFSNWTTPGSADASHTIAAPGVCITSTWNNGGYNTISGTSMASPHATGTVALCISSGACAGLTPAQIVQKMRADAAANAAADPTYGFAEDASSGGTKYYGHLIYAGGY
ncbi:MAG TPA: S8 family serine peptidase [Candidatus Limnocylindria bacterium]|jgi:subtilisin family serine protease|nr:S8 family serine peptidase [Candidatus Limnocylindria bacterium]